MNEEVLFTARRTIICKNFIGKAFVAVVGILSFIAGFVLMGMGADVADVSAIFILGAISLLLGGLLAIIEALSRRSNVIEFYDNKYIIKSGLISRHENEAVLTNLVSVNLSQTVSGRLFHYGTIRINIVGKHDISLDGVKYPEKLKGYLQGIINKTNANDFKQIISE